MLNGHQEQKKRILRIVSIAMFVAIGVVISPILRVEGLCPTAHLMNIIVAVFMGPWYALLTATLVGVIRMVLMNIPPLALTGAIFGAMLSGILYRLSKGKILLAVIGEIIGTGLIGSLASYPIMKLIWGRDDLVWYFYVPSFVLATIIGGITAFILLKTLRANGILHKIQVSLGVHLYENTTRNK